MATSAFGLRKEESALLLPRLEAGCGGGKVAWRGALADDEVCGVKVPRGATVTIAPWVLHRHAKLWENPACFIPERFSPANNQSRSCYAYLPFGTGPRVCIGTCSFSTWLTSTAINSALMVLRKRRARLEMSYDKTADSYGTVESWEFPHLTPRPERLCAGREQKCCCETQYFRLPWCYQTVAGLYHATECTTNEIARDLGISVATVKSRMYPGKEDAASIIA